MGVKDEEFEISLNGKALKPSAKARQKPPSGSTSKSAAPVKRKSLSGKPSAQGKRKPQQDSSSAQGQQESPPGSGQEQWKPPLQVKRSAQEQQESPLQDRGSAQEQPPRDTVHAKSHDPILKSHEILKQQHVAEWLFQNQHQVKSKGPSSSRVHWEDNKRSPKRRTVYLSNTFVQFPETMVGAESVVKVRLCNRDVTGHSFSVIKPSRPFSVRHVNFEIG